MHVYTLYAIRYTLYAVKRRYLLLALLAARCVFCRVCPSSFHLPPGHTKKRRRVCQASLGHVRLCWTPTHAESVGGCSVAWAPSPVWQSQALGKPPNQLDHTLPATSSMHATRMPINAVHKHTHRLARTRSHGTSTVLTLLHPCVCADTHACMRRDAALRGLRCEPGSSCVCPRCTLCRILYIDNV